MNNLFVFEGPDDVGKTTIVSKLEQKLLSIGKNCIQLSFPGRDLDTLGWHIYQVHHNPSLYNIDTMTPLSLQILHVAAHADVVERKILPLLKKEKTIILLDRYWWSTWAYGFVSNIPKSHLNALINLEKSFWNNIIPKGLFLFSRSNSNASEHLVQAYNELASMENSYYPIINLENNGTIDDAINKILPYIWND